MNRKRGDSLLLGFRQLPKHRLRQRLLLLLWLFYRPVRSDPKHLCDVKPINTSSVLLLLFLGVHRRDGLGTCLLQSPCLCGCGSLCLQFILVHIRALASSVLFIIFVCSCGRRFRSLVLFYGRLEFDGNLLRSYRGCRFGAGRSSNKWCICCRSSSKWCISSAAGLRAVESFGSGDSRTCRGKGIVASQRGRSRGRLLRDANVLAGHRTTYSLCCG